MIKKKVMINRIWNKLLYIVNLLVQIILIAQAINFVNINVILDTYNVY